MSCVALRCWIDGDVDKAKLLSGPDKRWYPGILLTDRRPEPGCQVCVTRQVRSKSKAVSGLTLSTMGRLVTRQR